MHAPKLIHAALAAAVLVMATVTGCGGGGEETSSTGSSTGSDTTTSSTTGGGGNGGTGGGMGGAGGQGGGSADIGVPATETVSAGEVSKSPNYKMVFTFGQPTQNQGKTTSPSFSMQGGLVGATGSAK